MKVYIVRRLYENYNIYCGEPVAAYLDKSQAKREEAMLNEKLRKARTFYNKYIMVSMHVNRSDASSYYEEAVKEVNKILPDFTPDQNYYFIEEVELYGDLKDEE